MKFSFYKIFLVFLISLVGGMSLQAQSKVEKGLAISTAYFDGGVHLRWAPTTYADWKLGVDNGYTLIRMTNSIQGIALSSADVYASATTLIEQYKGLSLQEWEDVLEVDTSQALGAMALALYGEGLTVVSLDTPSIASVRALQQVQKTRYGFSLMAAESNFDVAVKGGFGFFDDTIEANSSYTYYLLKSTSTPFTLENAVRIAISTAVETPIFDITLEEPQASVTDMTAYLQLIGDPRASLYSFQYSSNSGQSWQDLNSAKRYPAVATETGAPLKVELPWSIPQAGIPYSLRAIAYDMFQRESPASAVIEVTGQEPLPNMAIEIAYIGVGEEIDTIGWNFDVDSNPFTKGFKVLKGREKNGPFDTLTTGFIQSSEREALVQNVSSTSYYKVIHQDIRGGWHESFSILSQRIDSIPPEAPRACAGTIDKYGRYRLTWDRSPSDDVKAYEVYTNNSGTKEFFKVPGVRTSDTINVGYVPMDVLNREVYFQIRALDYRYNESEACEPCTLIRPDVIPPVPPVITPGVMNLSKLEINYVGSSSSDVVSHILERRQENGGAWEPIANIPMNDQISLHGVYEDTSIPFQATWEYRLVATDAAGNKGPSRSILVTPADLTSMPSSFSLTVIPDYTMQGMRLIWEYPVQMDANMIEFVLYKGSNPQKVEQYRVLLPSSSYQVGNPPSGPIVLNNNTGTFNVNLSTIVTHGGVDYYRVELIDQRINNRGSTQYCYQVTARSFNGGAVAGISNVECETYNP